MQFLGQLRCWVYTYAYISKRRSDESKIDVRDIDMPVHAYVRTYIDTYRTKMNVALHEECPACMRACLRQSHRHARSILSTV